MKKFIKSNLSNIAFSFALAAILKFFGDMTRTYAAFGGEDMVIIALCGYWYLRYQMYKEELERKRKRLDAKTYFERSN